MGDHISMSISVDSHSDETLNQSPLALLLRQQYEFPFGIDIVQFIIHNYFIFVFQEESVCEKSVWLKVERSFQQSSHEVCDLLHNKLQYLLTCRV